MKSNSSSMYIRLVVYTLLALAPLLVVMRYRVLPFDDGYRHAAKAISGKDWSDILVLRDDVTMDQHPGWHATLRTVHNVLHADQAFLVVFEWLTMFLLVTLCPIPRFQRPEAWSAALLLGILTGPYTLVFRLSRGRPYLLTEAILMILLLLWYRPEKTERNPRLMIVTTLLVALSAWIHGSWYLFALPAAAMLLGGGWKIFWRFSACCAVGVLLGATATGHPFSYIWQQFHHMLLAFGNGADSVVLVGEFKPIGNAGNWLALLTGVLLVYRQLTGEWPVTLLRSPIAIMAAIGWALGLHVARFWIDWGTPALLLLVGLLIQDILIKKQINQFKPRLLMATCFSFLCLLGITADLNARWSMVDPEKMPLIVTADPATGEQSNPANPAWMPEPGGIIYNPSMSIFCRLFYEYPTASWRYVLGFEPGIMPADDLQILRTIQRHHQSPESLQPWINKMRPEDRLILKSGPTPPLISTLQWHPVLPDIWSGSL